MMSGGREIQMDVGGREVLHYDGDEDMDLHGKLTEHVPDTLGDSMCIQGLNVVARPGGKYQIPNTVEDDMPVVDVSRKGKKCKVVEPDELLEEETHRHLEPPRHEILQPGIFKSKAKSKRKAEPMEEEESCSSATLYSHSRELQQATQAAVDNINQMKMKKVMPPEESCTPVRTWLNYDKKSFSGFEGNGINDELFTNVTKELKGGFGQVAKHKDVTTGKDLVIKRMESVSIRELDTPLRFNCPNIEKVFALGHKGFCSYIVLEDAGTNLREFRQNPQNDAVMCQDRAVSHILLDLLTAESVLAQSGITHSDIKPENICLKWCSQRKRYVATLIDFGSSVTSDDPPSSDGITPEYLPPDFNCNYVKLYKCKLFKLDPKQHGVRDLRALNCKDDIWALGMVMVFIKVGVHPMIKAITGNDAVNFNPGNQMKALLDRLMILEKIGEVTTLNSFFLTFPQCPTVEKVLPHMLAIQEDQRAHPTLALNMLKGALRQSAPPVKRMKSNVCFEDKVDTIPNMTHNLYNLKLGNGGTCQVNNSEVPVNDYPLSEYAVIDRQKTKAQPAAATVNPMAAMRQKKVVPQSPTDVDEYNSLVNSFMATDSQMPNVAFRENPKKVQAPPMQKVGHLEKHSASVMRNQMQTAYLMRKTPGTPPLTEQISQCFDTPQGGKIVRLKQPENITAPTQQSVFNFGGQSRQETPVPGNIPNFLAELNE